MPSADHDRRRRTHWHVAQAHLRPPTVPHTYSLVHWWSCCDELNAGLCVPGTLSSHAITLSKAVTHNLTHTSHCCCAPPPLWLRARKPLAAQRSRPAGMATDRPPPRIATPPGRQQCHTLLVALLILLAAHGESFCQLRSERWLFAAGLPRVLPPPSAIAGELCWALRPGASGISSGSVQRRRLQQDGAPSCGESACARKRSHAARWEDGSM